MVLCIVLDPRGEVERGGFLEAEPGYCWRLRGKTLCGAPGLERSFSDRLVPPRWLMMGRLTPGPASNCSELAEAWKSVFWGSFSRIAWSDLAVPWWGLAPDNYHTRQTAFPTSWKITHLLLAGFKPRLAPLLGRRVKDASSSSILCVTFSRNFLENLLRKV